jgi:hypothetical protein
MKLIRKIHSLLSLAVFVILLIHISSVAAQNSSSIQRPEQDSREYRGLQFGFNIGLFLPNAYSANYYNGSDGNENNIKYIFGNKYHYQDLYQFMNVSDTFFLKQCPTNMRYRATASAGLYIGFNLNRRNSIFVQFNYNKLKPQDLFTVEVDPKDYLTDPDLRLFSISGVEERINIDLGYSRNYPVTDNLDFVASAGLAINDSKVLKAVIKIKGEEINGNENIKEYSIVNVYGSHPYVPGSGMQQYEFTEGGIGYGVHGGGGLNINFANNFTLQPGVTLYYNNVDLKGYTAMKFSSYFYLRIIALTIN